MNVTGKATGLGLLLLITISCAALAQDDRQAQAPGHACAVHADPVQRLECYDRTFGAPAVAEQVEVAKDRAQQEFGLNTAEKRALPALTPQVDVDQIDATVVEVSGAAGGQRLVRLDNGQSWLIVERTIRGPIAVGDTVSVRRGLMGNHRLVTASGTGLRTRRVK